MYDAFISYSHALDGRLAPELRRALEAFAKPWYRRRAIRVFCDQSNLSATPQLWPTIQAALSASRFFILLASPAAAQSPWVGKELQTFVEGTGGADRVLIVLTDGELRWDSQLGDFDWSVTTAFPALSRQIFTTEPLWVDLRSIRRSAALTLRNRNFLDAVARLSSPVRSIALDDLVGEDLRRHRQTVRVTWTAAVVLVVLAAGLAAAGLYGYRRGQDALASAAAAKRSAAAAEAAAERTQAEFIVSSGNSLEANDPLAAALVVAELNDTYRSNRGLQLLRRLANELPLAILPSIRAVPSGDRSRVLTIGRDGAVNVYDARSLDKPKIFLGGGKRALDASFDLHGRRLAIAGDDDTVTVWDIDTNRRVSVSDGYKYRYLITGQATVSLSPDGDYVAFLSGNEARLMRVDGSRPPLVLRGHSEETSYVVFSPDGRNLATTSHDKTTRIWTLQGREEEALRVASSHPVYARFTPDGRGLLTHDDAGATHLWWRGGGGAVTFDPGEYNVSTPTLSPDGATVAATTKEGAVLLWRARTPGRPFVLRGHSDRVLQVDFSVDSKRLVSASGDGTARVWDLDSSEPVTFKVQKQAVDYAFFSADGLRIFAGSHDTRVFSTDRGEGEALLLRHGGEVTTVAFSPAGDRVVTASTDGTARVWNAKKAGPPLVLSGHDAPVSVASFGHDGHDVLTAGQDGTVRLWPINPPAAPLVLHVADKGPIDADRSPDGTRIVVAAHGKIQVWNLAGRDQPRTLSSTQRLESAKFSPDGKKIMAIGEHSAFLWNAERTETSLELTTGGHGRVVQGQFSPDGSRVVGRSAGTAGTNAVIVWQSDGSAPPDIRARNEPLSSITLSADGRRMLVLTMIRGSIESSDGAGEPLALDGAPSGWQRKGLFSRDGTHVVLIAGESAAIWRTDGPGAPLVLEGHRALLNDIAFSPNGTRVATASSDRTARVWSIDWSSLLDYVRARVRGLAVCLTDEERVQYLGEATDVARKRRQACLEPNQSAASK